MKDHTSTKRASILAAIIRAPEERTAQDTEFGRAILRGLQSKLMYGGSVPRETVRRRRAAAKRAKASRKINRR